MLRQLFGRLPLSKQSSMPEIKVKLNDLNQLSANERQVFAKFLNETKQKVSAAVKEDILYANTPYRFSCADSDGSMKSYLIILDVDLACYSRKKNESDRRFAVVGELIGSGQFGSVHKSETSLSVSTSSDTTTVIAKLKSAEKSRVVKWQNNFRRSPQDQLLAERECRLTRIGSPELRMKSLVWQTAKRETAIVMHYMPGEDLFDVLDEDKLTNDVDRLQICLSLAENLARIHANGIIHRDIKPENIRVNRGADGRYTAAIVDFGLATEAANPEAAGCGSPLYAAPEMFQPVEVIRARGTSIACDIYSLGRVFETIFGRSPSWADSIPSVLKGFSKPFDEVFTKHPATLEKKALEDLFITMREIDPAKRMPLADVIVCLRALQDKLQRIDNRPSLSSATPSLFASSQAASAAAAAAPQQQQSINDDGYDEDAFRRSCS